MKSIFKILSIFIFSLFTFQFSSQAQIIDSISPVKIYRYFAGNINGFKVWIVDGYNIRTNIFGEFVYGGNSARYTFVPEGEIWIDNAISANEYTATLEHEINECNLMYKNNMDYYDAHDSSLSLELKLRSENNLLSRNHEKQLPEVSPIDFDSVKVISSLPDEIKLKNIYIEKFASESGTDIWIVNGYNIRKNIYPDFGFSGNSEAYMFIPKNEIWIDGNVSCEEIWYSIELEGSEYGWMKKGVPYDSAYVNSLVSLTHRRQTDQLFISELPYIKYSEPLFRDKVK